MNLPLPEYRAVRLLRESGRSRVFEAVSEPDGRRVIAKVFDIEDPSVEDRVLHELELIERLDIPGVVVARELRRAGDQLVLVLDHVGGVNLCEFTGGAPLELARFWPIATQLADILAQTHAHKVIHRDIKPSNVIIDDAGGVHLIDFGISVLLEDERRHMADDSALVGTLPYISPEQTGRTNRTVDVRSDLYSLGVTFYQLLTGRLPFEEQVPLEIIHAHLARTPEPPAIHRPSLPEALSRVISKLLEKAPEHRYHSAAGLAADLRAIAARLETSADDGLFELGSADVSPHLQLPHRPYGRASEAAALVTEYRAVVDSGRSRTILLTGPAGIGKSTLLSVLDVAIVGDGGYLARGTFTQQRELPYSGFIAALTGLCEQLLTETDARLARWRRRLRESLGTLAGVLCELIAPLVLVLGEQPASLALEPIESRNRLLLAFDRLIAAFCQDQRPFVLILDNLQWADDASLALFETLLGSSPGPLLLIATGRLEPEQRWPWAESTHRRTLHRSLQVWEIGPLAVEAIGELLGDTLKRTQAEVEQLARVVARKTGGVPLLVRQFLGALVERGALRPGSSHWTWDPAAVELTQIPDDAVAMMRGKLASLDPDARDLLGRAACIGLDFDLAQLALITAGRRTKLTALCFELVDLGVLSSLGHGFCFAHESLQHAALLELGQPERRALHWTIGRQQLELGEGAGDGLFGVVDHLNLGAPLELTDDSRLELAQLNLKAGARALDSGAYELALRYLDHGVELVEVWTSAAQQHGPTSEYYALIFDLHFARAQSLGLANPRNGGRNGGRDSANEAFNALLRWDLADHHFGRVVARRCRILCENNLGAEALDLGLAAMARLGLRVPPTPSRLRVVVSLVRAWALFRSLGREGFLAMPPCTDERMAALIEIVAETKYAAFTVDPQLTLQFSWIHLGLIRRYGFHPSTSVALADLSIVVSGALGRPNDGVAMVETALDLCARAPNPASARLGVLAPGVMLTMHRGRSFSEVMRLLDGSYPLALENGDFGAASMLAMLSCLLPVEVGTHLRGLERRCCELAADVERWGSKQSIAMIWAARCWCVSMLGSGLRDGPESGESNARAELLDVRDIEPEMIRARGGAHSAVCMARVNLAMFHLIMGEAQQAIAELLDFIDDVAKIALNSWFVPRAALVMVVSVERLRLGGQRSSKAANAASRRSLGLLRRWAETGPDNYGHYLDLALGVRAASRGRFEGAIRLLEQAWAKARRRGCRWVEGLAAECSAELLEARGLELLADGARRRAWQAYALWGATAKLERLRAASPQLFSESSRAEFSTDHASSEHSSTPSPDLDRVLRSVGVITEELNVEQVARRVLDAAVTSAGADHGMLLLERDGELGLVARATGDGGLWLFEDAPLLRDASDRAPVSLINFVTRTNRWLVVDDASNNPRFAGDPYLERNEVRSVLALPIIKSERQLGVLVLENRLTSHGFSASTIETLRLITGQAASILDNARLHAALGRSEARWRSLVDSAPDVIALLDERGEIALLNRQGPFANDSMASDGALTPEAAARWRDAIAVVLGEGRAQELELEFVALTGVHRWYEARLAPIELEPGSEHSRRNAVCVATDISERKRGEADKQALEAQLRQQQRLDSIGTLASGVAHEINNPIQGIMNYAELIRDRSGDPTTVEEFADEIVHESNRVASIVRNLLAFSRQEQEQQRELVELSWLVDSTLSLIRSILRKDYITLIVEPVEGQPRVNCQVQSIQQIIMNLVTNARDALNERYGGHDERKRITVRVERITRAEGAAWGRVVVEDTGGGIEPEVVARIFDPFFTTKARDKGTGLGLAVSRGIALDNDGELSVETRAGEGTRFYLDLPLAD